MTILDILDKLILGSLQLLMECIYAISVRMTGNYWKSIIVLSLAVNLLLLPLYRRADAMQKEERDRTLRMKPRVDQIKKKFSGNERFLILQTYYRQCHYKPYYALKGSVSLLLQIPFFMAAYRFLSGLLVLKGVSLGPIHDLSLPDGMLQIGGTTINVLPILMTLINIISGMILLKDMPLKSKIQMYGLAAVFLVLLYNSPSGLVFYWTLNNLFSLIKNIIGRIRHKDAEPTKKPKKPEWKASWITQGQCKGIFWFACIFLVILTGLLIPSAVLKSSTAEFLDIRYLQDPMRYLVHTFLSAAGFFLLWSGIYFCLSGEKAKRIIAGAYAALAAISAVNFTFFSSSYGDITSFLKYQNPISISTGQKWVNVLVILVIIALVVFLIRKLPGILRAVCLASCVALLGVSVMNMSAIQDHFRENEKIASEVNRQTQAEIHLSKNGKNVMILMLDRAIGEFVPYLMNEKPELVRQFDGFTYYPNTLSFGYHTNVAAPALYGGYEYTPDEMDQRDSELLVDKHNEALKVMPVLFRDNGYDVTVIDQSLANYQWISDLSIYDDDPEIHRYNALGSFSEDLEETVHHADTIRNRNLFCYSIFRISPQLIQPEVYDDGNYNDPDAGEKARLEKIESGREYSGPEQDFLDNYLVMQNLHAMTKISESDENCLLVIANEETHCLVTLREPDYYPEQYADNTEYDQEHPIRTDAAGHEINLLENDTIQMPYHVNMSTFLQLGRWFDYLRENEVWDNTRIILVSDHAFPWGVFGFDLADRYPELKNEARNDGYNWTNTMGYEPLLMVKDFNATGFTTDDTFMTNADTPTLAAEGLIENPVNPFTGKPIASEAKKSGELHLVETDLHIEANNGYKFADPLVITFRGDDIHDFDNWSYGE